MRASVLVASLPLVACAAAPAPEPKPAAVSIPAAVPDNHAEAPPPGDPLEQVVDAYVAAANAGDQAKQQAGATSDCWQKECASFAYQAGRKFHVERRSEIPRQGNHAVVTADIVCDGSRKCDLAYLLFVRDPTRGWIVADITEDEKKAGAWTGSAP